MCAACGVLGGGPDWLDRSGSGEPASSAPGSERQRRIALVNLLLETPRLRLRPFGPCMVIGGPTGRSEIVEDLRHVWMQADRLSASHVDPLDPALLDRLASQSLARSR
ncbi:MAG: hypothetical protein J0H94_07130 [Rhizobiales bacterium]|nr:hypothetical protein [Hyphomicrobiales bacterium]